MKRFLTPLPIGIVLVDLIYGFVLNVMQGLNLQQTAANQSGTISVTPDIAFNSLQIRRQTAVWSASSASV